MDVITGCYEWLLIVFVVWRLQDILVYNLDACPPRHLTVTESHGGEADLAFLPLHETTAHFGCILDSYEKGKGKQLPYSNTLIVLVKLGGPVHQQKAPFTISSRQILSHICSSPLEDKEFMLLNWLNPLVPQILYIMFIDMYQGFWLEL